MQRIKAGIFLGEGAKLKVISLSEKVMTRSEEKRTGKGRMEGLKGSGDGSISEFSKLMSQCVEPLHELIHMSDITGENQECSGKLRL